MKSNAGNANRFLQTLQDDIRINIIKSNACIIMGKKSDLSTDNSSKDVGQKQFSRLKLPKSSRKDTDL